MELRDRAINEMSYWRDRHLSMADALDAGEKEDLIARYQEVYMTAEFHRKAAADYERWLEAIQTTH